MTEKGVFFSESVGCWDFGMLEQILGTPLVLKMLILSQLHCTVLKLKRGKCYHLWDICHCLNKGSAYYKSDVGFSQWRACVSMELLIFELWLVESVGVF